MCYIWPLFNVIVCTIVLQTCLHYCFYRLVYTIVLQTCLHYCFTDLFALLFYRLVCTIVLQTWLHYCFYRLVCTIAFPTSIQLAWDICLMYYVKLDSSHTCTSVWSWWRLHICMWRDQTYIYKKQASMYGKISQCTILQISVQIIGCFNCKSW